MSAVFILKDEQRRSNLVNYVRSVSIIKPLLVTFASKFKRTENQNKYWHTLVGIIAEYRGEHPRETKLLIKYECLELRPIKTLRGEEYLVPVSTTQLDRQQFADLIDKTLAYAVSQGIIVPNEQYLGLD